MEPIITKKTLRNELLKAIAKNPSFKSFIRELNEKLQEFIDSRVNIIAFRTVFYTGPSFKIYYKYDDEEEDSSFEINVNGFEAEITVFTSTYKAIQVSTNRIINIVVDIILNTISPTDLMYPGTFKSLELKDKFPLYIHKLIAWSSNSVGTYHVEQENGQGWIILPKEPKGNEFKGFYNFK